MKTLSNLDNALRLADRRPGLNILLLAAAVQDGETLSFGSTVFEVDLAANPGAVSAGRVRVNLSGSATAAAAARVGTFSGNPADGDTMGVGGSTYTFKNALAGGGSANQILIGADLTATRNNSVAAITGAAGAGTTYGTGTVAHTTVTATPSSTNALTITAKAKGTAGNAITLADGSSAFSWASAATTLTGGADPTADEFATALAATNAENISITKISGTEVLFVDMSKLGATRALACSDTLAGSGNQWAAANTYGFQGEPETPRKRTKFTRVPTASEVTKGNLHLALGFTPTTVRAQVFVTATGAAKAWGGTITRNGRIVTLTNNATNDFAATDTVLIIAEE